MDGLANARKTFYQEKRHYPTHLSVNIDNDGGQPFVDIDIDNDFAPNMTHWISDVEKVRGVFFGYTYYVNMLIDNLYYDYEADWVEEG